MPSKTCLKGKVQILNTTAYVCNRAYPSSHTVYRRVCLWSLEQWGRGFESRLRHGYMSAFLCVVMSCLGRGNIPVQRVLPKCLKGYKIAEVSSELEQHM